MLIILSLSSLITFTGCVNVFPFMNRSISNMPRDYILSQKAATQLCSSEIFLGFKCPNALSNDCLFMQMTAAPVSNNHESYFPFWHVSLGLILSPLKGIMISKSILQVAIVIVHKLRINWGMMLGVCMRGWGVIKLINENPTAVPFSRFHFWVTVFCPSHTLWAKRCIRLSLQVFFL